MYVVYSHDKTTSTVQNCCLVRELGAVGGTLISRVEAAAQATESPYLYALVEALPARVLLAFAPVLHTLLIRLLLGLFGLSVEKAARQASSTADSRP